MVAMAHQPVDEDPNDLAVGQTLELEAVRYLEAVETFRAEDCEPTWELETAA